MVLTPNEVTDEGVTQLVKICNGRHNQFIEPYPCYSPKGCQECSANDFIWGLLESQNSFDRPYVIKGNLSAIVNLQLRETKFGRQRALQNIGSEGWVCPLNHAIKVYCCLNLHGIFYFI